MIARALFVALLACSAIADPVTVRLWDDPTPIEGEVVTDTPQAITVKVAEDRTVRVPWTRVARVVPAPTDTMAAHAQAGLDAWRAWQRLDRADVLGAEPLLERHADGYLGLRGEVSGAIAAGLVRCRLARGDRAGAVAPWVAMLRVADADEFAERVGLDAATGLHPDLVPIWTDEEAGELAAHAESLRALAPIDSRERRLLDLMLLSASWQVAADADRPALAEQFEAIRAKPRPNDDADALLIEVVGSVVAEDRDKFRARLETRVARPAAPWQSAWAGIAIARSLIAEPDDGARRRGAVQLLDTALRIADTYPALSVLALRWGAAAAGMVGDDPAAGALRDELARRFPAYADPTRLTGKDTPNP
ncbi:MAG: hypothetical protein R3B49_04080 [Phycisphaerales bacterium]